MTRVPAAAGVYIGKTVVHDVIVDRGLFVGMTRCGQRFELGDRAYVEHGQRSFAWCAWFTHRCHCRPLKPCMLCVGGGRPDLPQLWRRYQRESWAKLLGTAQHQTTFLETTFSETGEVPK